MSPRASVLLPVFEAAGTLEACLHSVARQTAADLECVVVDDGSTDGSLELARAFALRDPRFRVLDGPHQGLVPTLMRGLEACRAPIVVRMDADDVMHRERLALQLAALERADAVGCHVRLFPRAQLSDGRRAYERWLNAIDSPARLRADAYVECPIAHPTLAIRRELLRDVGYRDAGWPEDWDLVLRLLARGARLDVVPRRLLLWRDRPTRLSRTDPTYGLDRFVRCRAHHLAAQFLAGQEGYVLWGHGGTGRALRAALARHGKRPHAIVEVHPGRLGQRIDGAPVVPPNQLLSLRGDLPVLVSVAGLAARTTIRTALVGMGLAEGRDFVCCA
ncbi:MAG: glycosyltransferase family 2 protein [Deltaproteobacteria bacterium]|nr:glycosyltransferase family 2 protein [Deltaproteobacteria bacterium]